MAKTRWDIEIGYTTNTSSLKSLEANFLRLQSLAKEPGNAMDQSLQIAAKDAEVLYQAMKKCYNTDLGALNTAKFTKELTKAGMTVDQCRDHFRALAQTEGEVGATGQKAFYNLGSAILGTNLYIKEANKTLDNFARTFANTIKYNISGGIYREVVGSVSQAIGYTRHLDTSLNDIRIVTDKSADSMARFAKEANTAAKAIGASTLDYTEASLIFYQQGLDDAETKARTEATLKAANVTGQSGAEVSEQLTAVWNGYKVSAEETELYVDKLAAVAATTAADLEELSTGMSKVASAANAMGVDVDQLNAQLATIVSVTRQAPESVGTALKTIYARMSTIEAGGEEEGTNLKNYTETMAKFGISVLDGQNKLRDMGDVMEEVGNKWATMSREQQVALAQAMAGTRQYNNLLALFENWDMYNTAVETSANAMGTLQHQQDIYMESTEAHLQQMRTAAQGLYDTMIDNKEINAGIDVMTDFIKVINTSFESFGGGFKSILLMGGTLATLFSDQIGRALANASDESQQLKNNFIAIAEKQQQLQQQNLEANLTNPIAKGQEAYYTSLKNDVEGLEKLREVGTITTEQYNTLLNLMKEKASLTQQNVTQLENQKRQYEQIGKAAGNEKEIHDLIGQIIKDNTYDTETFYKEFDKVQQEVDAANEALQEETEELEKQKEKLDELIQKREHYNKLFMNAEPGSSEETRAQNYANTYNDKAKAQEIEVKNQQKLVDSAAIRVDKANATNIVMQSINENIENITDNEDKRSKIEHDIDATQKSIIKSNAENVSLSKITLGTVGALSSSYLSISNVIRVLNDENASFGQKAAQIGMTLSMTFPMLVTSISKVVDGYKALNQAMETGVFLESILTKEEYERVTSNGALITAEMVRNALEKEGIRTTFLAIAQQEGLSAAIKKTTKALWENTTAKLANTAAGAKNGVSVGKGGSEVAGLFSGGLKGAGVAEGLASALGAVAAALTAVAAVAAAVYTWYKVYTNSLKENAQAADQAANASRTQTEALQKEYDSVKTLADEYNELKRQYEDGIITADQLKDKTFELCTAYGDQSLILKSLTGDYKDIEKAIEDLEKHKVIDFANSAETTRDLQKGSVKAALREQAKTRIDSLGYGQDTIDLKGMSAQWAPGESAEATALDTLAQQYGINNLWANKDHMNLNALVDLMAKDYQGVQTILNTYDTEMSKQLLGYFSNINTEISELTEDVNTANDAIKSGLSASLTDGQINIENYQATREQLIQDLLDKEVAIDKEHASKYADEILSAFSEEALKNTKANTVAGIIFGEDGYTEEQFKQIANMSSDQIAALASQAADVTNKLKTGYYKDLNDWSSRNDSSIKLRNNIDTQARLQVALEAATKNGKFSEEDVNQLFTKDGKEIKLKVGLLPGGGYELSKDQFNAMDYDAQSLALTQSMRLANEEAQAEIASLEERKAEIEQQIADIQNGEGEILVEITQDYISKCNVFQSVVAQGLEDFGASEERIASISIDKIDEFITSTYSAGETLNNVNEDILKGIGRFLDGDKFVLEKYYINNQLTEEGAKLLNDYATAYSGLNDENHKMSQTANELASELASVNADIEAYSDKLISEKEILDSAKATMKATNNSLDQLQSSYKTLSDAVASYNKEGELSLDTIQSLLMMDSEYLSTLEIENGKLSINKEAYEGLVAAKKAKLKADAIEQFMAEINIATENAVADANQQAAEKEYLQASAIASLTDAANESLPALHAMIQELNMLDDVSIDSEALAKSEKALQQRLRLADSITVESLSSGSSGGGSSKKDKELKKLEDEFDRYWDLNKAIDAVELSLSRLDKLQSNLHGKELIRSLQKENKLLAEQKSRYEDLYAEQLKEAGELQGKLANFGVAFGADGAISNYAQATQNALAQFNEAVNAYNAGTLSDEAYEAAEKTYQAFKDALERYDTLYYDEMKATQDKLIDLWKEELANNLEAWTTEIQIQLDLSEAERQWNDFLHDIGENFKAEYEDISFDMKNYLDDALTYAGAQGTVSTRINAISDVEREIDKLMGGQDSDMFESVSQAQEKLKELRDQLEDDALAVHNLWKKAWDDYLKSIDQGEKKLDDLMNKFKQIDNELEFQGQLIELIYGDKAFNLMDKLYNAQSKNSLAQVDSVRQQRDMWKKLYDEAEEGNADRAKYYDLWIEAQNNLNDLVVEHIELLKNDYLNTVNSIIDTVKKNTVGGDLDFAKTQWSDRKSMEEGFYDDTERVYQIETMQNKWEEVISNAPLNQQKKLTELMNQQLENLKDKTRLSEYDIGLAERELQIAQARLDLENAQNNKNSMKVTRGTDGNWSYQYVADEEDVANKQQALLDAINDKYEYIKQKNQEVLESLLENTEKYWERYYEILADTTLKDEEREARLAELWETYYGEEGLLTVAYAQSEQTKQDLNQATFELLDEAYVQNVESYSEMTAAQQALIDGLKDGTIASYEDIQAACQVINDESLTSWQTMARDMADAWNADDGQSIKSQVLAAMDECQRALDEYGLAIDYLAAVADMDFSEAGISGSINQAEQATEQLTLSTGILIDEIQSDLANALGVVSELEQSWYGVRDAILEAIGALSEYLSLVGQEKEFNFDNPTKTVSALLDSLQAGAGNGAGSAGKKTSGGTLDGDYTYWTTDNQGNKLYRNSKTGTVVSETQLSDSATKGTATDWLNFNSSAASSSTASSNTKFGMTPYTNNQVKHGYYDWYGNKHYVDGAQSRNDVVQAIRKQYGDLVSAARDDEILKEFSVFKTGGYTGEWGSEGRMAMLHEKELVLNAADTKNILSVVDTVRDLSGLGTSISSVIADGIANTLAKLAGIRSGSVATPAPGMASAAGNTFNITAEFPNANDVNEIREAILSLPNLASQYVNQKLK